ncbi:hypothetical protein ES703_54525 [subsurface metagenome]
MNPEFIQCELCKAKIPSGSICELATYRTVINGKEYVFCCAKCAERYQKKKK